jgi:TPR repeat protein
MMPGMMPRLLILVAALTLMAPAARAQFYDLDGAYRCLTAPSAACEQDLRDQPRPDAKPPPSEPTLAQVIAKVRDKTAGPREIELLTKRAAANDPRAVEVLAWCKLNAIGTSADPVAAYWLYRQAAALGVANARRNQIAIYEKLLTPEERQQVLTRENAR